MQEKTSKARKEHTRRKKPHPSRRSIHSGQERDRSDETMTTKRFIRERKREGEREKERGHRYKEYIVQSTSTVQKHSKSTAQQTGEIIKKEHLQHLPPPQKNETTQASQPPNPSSKKKKNHHRSTVAKNPRVPPQKFQNSTLSPNLTSFLPCRFPEFFGSFHTSPQILKSLNPPFSTKSPSPSLPPPTLPFSSSPRDTSPKSPNPQTPKPLNPISPHNPHLFKHSLRSPPPPNPT